MKIENMTSAYGNKVANQFKIIGLGAGTFHDGDKRLPSGDAFQSYESIIAFVDYNGKVYLDKTYWDYSVTTSKYRNAFLNMTTPAIKAAIKKGEIKLIDLNG